MSTETAKQTAKQTETDTTNKPGIFSRGLQSISNTERRAAVSHPIFSTAVGAGVALGTAKLAAPVATKAASAVKKWFGGAARKAGEEVTREVAAEGAKNFVGGAGSLRKLFR
jgi:hypothetical protein